ncbi:type II toxin-antitoxin system Phd/YefM family antitoxin [Corynebacterium sp. p3-SID1145]|uniref:type II toxin-antitoxin system Phd/YefM family antitoxin n=1 Tax=unclassified Corynebacterium TaxID=2624378 RepID=UPI0021A9C66D|nr:MULTISPECIES: type II toxin-antitoxin system Phd/YefM family antitoxin [unclassified Corynebacterium]MCT1453157.1 type II toxin-antitoxin system Phd/YefM family antitoxin [Corynebacterium sp. p3-SID1145]MCT1462268.1 type II toxin-antitoxin system Phd/YefM family antitoxin [Corynebacterium sp. p3-SID1140]
METINVHDAKTHFSRLLRRVEAGEELVISRGGQPVARMVPLEVDVARPLGFVDYTLPDSFFDDLPQDELEAWE